MKNPAPYIKQQLFSLLDGLQYEGTGVPVYENTGDYDRYMISIGDPSPTPYQTKVSKMYAYEANPEVIYEGASDTTFHIDRIAEQVMQKVQPSLYTNGIPDSAEWQITSIKINAPRYLTDLSADNNYIKRAIINIQFTIIER